MSPILTLENSRRGSMHAMFRDRRILTGLALGGALAAIVFVWNRASHEGEANARLAEPITSTPIEAPTAARKLDAPAESSAAPQAGFARYEDYFNRNYYATYAYASPAQVPADWGRTGPADGPPAPPSAFTLPSVADLLDPGKLVPNAPLAVPSTLALPDVSRLAPAATVSMPAPSSPVGLLTNPTPFHLFVTSDPVSAAASTASEAPSVASSGGASVSTGGGITSTVTGTTGSVTGTAGSLLHK
jgi:hypothetical protein